MKKIITKISFLTILISTGFSSLAQEKEQIGFDFLISQNALSKIYEISSAIAPEAAIRFHLTGRFYIKARFSYQNESRESNYLNSIFRYSLPGTKEDLNFMSFGAGLDLGYYFFKKYPVSAYTVIGFTYYKVKEEMLIPPPVYSSTLVPIKIKESTDSYQAKLMLGINYSFSEYFKVFGEAGVSYLTGKYLDLYGEKLKFNHFSLFNSGVGVTFYLN